MMVVADASVLLAVLRGEPGWKSAMPHMRGARLSAVNYSETLAKAGDKGIAAYKLQDLLTSLEIDAVAFGREYADVAADLRPLTRVHNVS